MHILKKINLFTILILFPFSSFSQWQTATIDSLVSFRGISVVDDSTVWVSGTKGSVFRTINGVLWSKKVVKGAENLDFRDIEAIDSSIAYIMSSGEAEKRLAKIFKTNDGGKTWVLQFETIEKGVFLDGIDFWDEQNGIAFGDPVNGKFYLLSTNNGGQTWERLNTDGLPNVFPKEAAFAASGTTLRVSGNKDIWIGSGGHNGYARVFHSADKGLTWKVMETPIKSDKNSGIYGITIYNNDKIMLLGGNYEKPTDVLPTTFISTNNGKDWQWTPTVLSQGIKEAGIFMKKNVIYTVGPAGSSFSGDGGKTWRISDTISFHSIDAKGKVAWAAGKKGLVGKAK